ncbi:alpha-mannosidase [Paenibacillus antri]|uniref:Alpha-mannosidase n=1 Tax=Paenibacillus antri TaxID=2582848 RepID=A0A5R9GBR4_9BACL|nr:glycoside hydrolase family 38 C-terminal domain-containing protein [Paenibacillus antri]TLS53902.1 alpha-mannosidase [Paenibacillus antri]
MNTSKKISELTVTVDGLRGSLRAKKEQLQAIASLSKWQYTNEIVSVEQCPALHRNWEEARIRYAWPPQKSDKTFYRQVRIPAEFMGLKLTGSEALLEICLLIGSDIFINGERVYAVDYWADTKVVPIPLTAAVNGNEVYDIVIHCRKGDGLGYFHDADLRIGVVEEWLYTLDTFSEELRFVLFLLQNGDANTESHVRAVKDSLAAFSVSALEENRWEELERSIASVREKLRSFEPYAKKYRIYLVGHAHIDMNWLWPWSETEDLIRRDFESVDGMMEEYPDVCFSHSQAATYRAMQERYPELWARVKARIDQGRWDVTASTWVEGDLNMAGYETMIRQLVEGISYCRDELGVSPEICWEPDTFGHPATMPDILSQAGLKYYYFCRAGKGASLFWWEGEHGSRVLAFQDPRHYNGRIYASDIVPGTIEMAKDYGLSCNMYVYGIGDHGGGVTKQDIRRGIRLNESRLLPRFIFSGSTAFYRDVESSGVRLPVIQGELNTIFEGCYTSHGDIKRANRETEHALVQAESLTVIADAYSLASGTNPPPPAETEHALREPWRTQCFNQFHDIVCGCAIQVTYQEAVPASRDARSIAESRARRAMERTIPGSRGASDPVVTVFNSLSWSRTDIVTLQRSDFPQIEGWETGDEMINSSGNRTPIQKMNDGSVVFLAEEIPAYGFASYRYSKAAGAKADGSNVVSAGGGRTHILENNRYRLAVDSGSGTITSLLDKTLQRELTSKAGFNLLEVHDEAPHGMSAWHIGPITRIHRLVRGAEVSAVTNGPVVQSIAVVHRHQSSEIRQEIRMYAGIERIDVLTRVNWQEKGTAEADAPMLKVSFATQLQSPDAVFDIPFGTIRREANGQEVPAIHWCGVSEAESPSSCGVTLLNNGKFGCSIQGSTISLTLLRSSYEPDNLPDLGLHEFAYSVYPHASDWKAGQADRRAWEFNQPMAAHMSESGDAPLSEPFGAIRIEELGSSGWQPSEGLLATAFKPAFGSSGTEADYVLRLFEPHNRPTRARIAFSFPVEFAEEVNLVEDKIRRLALEDDRRLDLGNLSPGAIVTLRLRAAKSERPN